MTTELNKVQYTDQDFEQVVLSVQDFISTNYPEEFNDYNASNLGNALIEIIAYAQHNLNWYINRRVTDLYFPTAVSPDSVTKIARMLGYKPIGAIGSIATITVSLTKVYTFPITIQNGFQFKASNGLVYEYRGTTPVIYLPGELEKTFEVKEGFTSVLNVFSNGLNNQTFRLQNIPNGKFVEQGSIKVDVDGIDWPEYGVIPYQNIPAFEANILNSSPFLKFGDGVQGSVPVSGAGIRIRYSVVSGFNGRILSNSITQPLIPLVVKFETIPLIISQPSNSIGGDSPEPIKKITTNAPRFQRTQDRAITKGDYDFIGNTFPNVARSDAQVIRSISGDITFNSIYDAVNSDLQNIFTLGQSASGYQNVSGYVNSVSGNINSITGINQLIDTSYQNVSGLIDSSMNSLFTVKNQILSEISALGSVSGSGVSGVIIPVINSLSNELVSIQNQINQLNSVNISASGFLNYPMMVSSIFSNCNSANASLQTINILANNVALFVQVSGYSQSAISGMSDLYGYLNSIISDGCRSNTVQVSILGKDVARKYVSPAASTLISLKQYLDDRKDITHDVVVVSGTARVINADVLVEAKLTNTADEDVVIQKIKDSIDRSSSVPFGILVEREFNKSLYIDELYATCRAVVEDFEVSYLNVIIIGPTNYLDSRGNLICPEGFVIQSGNTLIKKIK